MASIQITASMGGSKKTIHNLQVIPEEMLSDEGLRNLTRVAAEGYAGYIRDEHLSGQRLKVQTGTLKDAIVSRSVSGSTDAIVTAGSLRYSRIHDTGYDDPRQTVREHRKVNSTGTGFVTIGSYTRHANQRKRRYFSDAVVEGHFRAQSNIDVVVADYVRRANGN